MGKGEKKGPKRNPGGVLSRIMTPEGCTGFSKQYLKQ